MTFSFGGEEPKQATERDQLLWDFGLSQVAVELEQDLEEQNAIFSALIDAEAKHITEIAELQRAISTRSKFNGPAGCEDIIKSTGLCHNDLERYTKDFEALSAEARA
eukprot:CAMPEP_0206185794 /NCGR_PEP_ID=MMETSP0166-20121206/2021_1 /ASSEMBLY_ACC=CAM_ASM_000260 /TAXON_ID=95228 /ORGANISM="Vannella robusta, Strain DIVA3 518/3/11/1/6" /LENGTH=106 /DNA_ID=CAMNT_0053601059 /DNA_START=38 /DNA_END=355 /DNA_ORIENTATION=-